MIEKMKFLSITGPREDIDRVADTYLSRYEIHLENALSELKTVKNLRPYIEVNPYRDQLAMARSLMQRFGGQLPEVALAFLLCNSARHSGGVRFCGALK